MIVNKVICGPYVMILENITGYSAAKKAENFIIVRIKYTNILKFIQDGYHCFCCHKEHQMGSYGKDQN